VVTVTGSVIYVRAGAGVEYPKIDTVVKGKVLKVVGQQKDSNGAIWYAVMLGDKLGFVDGRYCKLSSAPSSQTSSSSSTSSSTSGASSTSVTTSSTTQPVPIEGVTRLGGKSRLDTAILVSQEGWDSANAIIIANGYSFADSLAGVPLAKALDAPVLLTGGTELEASVAAEIERLGAKTVYILGGELAVSEQVEKDIEARGAAVKRIAGQSRYATAVEIARELSNITGSQPTVLYFASAENYPDALAISTVAALEGNPILYLPSKGQMDSNTVQYVTQSTCSKAVILGGELAVSIDGENSVRKYIPAATRISGTSRYDTALRICAAYASLYTSDDIALATGTNYPDALSGGAFAAKYGMPIILVGAAVNDDIVEYTDSLDVDEIYVFGGITAVPDEVVGAIAK